MQLEQLELTGGGTLTLYLRESVEAMPHFRQRPLVLVVPGGGYTHVSPRESDPVALQFAAAGYHTAVLHYAVGESARDALPMRQLAQAIGLVRQHAEQWNILPDKIALCGFSAGGHLALSGAVWEIPGMADQPRPNALLLAYPVVTAGEYAHRDSFVQLPGTQDVAAHQRLTLEDKINPATPTETEKAFVNFGRTYKKFTNKPLTCTGVCRILSNGDKTTKEGNKNGYGSHTAAHQGARSAHAGISHRLGALR